MLYQQCHLVVGRDAVVEWIGSTVTPRHEGVALQQNCRLLKISGIKTAKAIDNGTHWSSPQTQSEHGKVSGTSSVLQTKVKSFAFFIQRKQDKNNILS